jgi:hypothetical protein
MDDQTNVADISQAQLQVVALARCVSDNGIDISAANALLDDMDSRLCLIVSARLLHACCRDLAHFVDCDVGDLLYEMTRVAVEAGAADGE